MTREEIIDGLEIYTAGRPNKDRVHITVKELQKFIDKVKSLEQEPCPKTERCRWIRYDYRTICPQSHDIDNPYWRIPEKRMDVLKYCPYCGKEIEVTE